jgi:hypothetical protein
MFFACASSVDQSHAACVCIIRMHAHRLILSLLVVGFGQYLSYFHCLILGPSHEYYTQRKDTVGAWPRNILATKLFAYTVANNVYLVPSSFSAVASTLASGTGGVLVFSSLAAFAYSGARVLQWPHLKKQKQAFKFKVNSKLWMVVIVKLDECCENNNAQIQCTSVLVVVYNPTQYARFPADLHFWFVFLVHSQNTMACILEILANTIQQW